MYSRRALLQASAAGLGLGAGIAASTSNATAAGASFGDGVNLQPAYFCSGEQAMGWDLMDQYPDVQTVRIEIEPPSMGESQAELSDAKRWIDEAYERGYHVIATYHHHPHNGSDDPADLQSAADWWVEHYDFLTRDAECTINLMNEWGDHQVTAEEYAAAYNGAIDTLRTGTDYDGPIVCDVPGWGQGTHRAADAAPQLQDDDLILSVHVYPKGWNATTGEALQPEHLDVVDETEYPCTIGEFGSQPQEDGDADWSAIVDHANDLGWPVIGWAWNGGGGGMDMVDPYWGDGCPETYSTSSYFDVIYDKLQTGSRRAPPQPSDVQIVDYGEFVLTIGWDPVDLANSYVVYAGDTVVETTTDTEATVDLRSQFGDDSIDHGDVLEIGVAASNDIDDSSITRISLVLPDDPTGLSVVSESPSEATVGWDAVENADSYTVYAGDTLLHSTEETETTITEFPTEDTYVAVGIEAENAAGTSSVQEILVRRCVDEPSLELPGADVTCDGTVGQGDVAEFFSRQHREPWKRRSDLFDFSGNGAVTHGDVVELADYVALQ